MLVHLAAVLPLSFQGDEADRAARINNAIDRNVLATCGASGVNVIYASGASVYGFDESRPKSESSPVHATGPYVQAKLEGERMGKEMVALEGLTFTSLRISAPYGPGQRARTVLNIFIEEALKHRPLRYYGTGSRQQDFTYIDDVASAVCRAAAKSKGGVYNIAGGAPVTMKELAEIVVRCVPGCEARWSLRDADVQESATARYSIEKARSELEWQPRVSLEEGIRACVNARLNQL
jgi:UDP-glucose 4-epimerase